MRKFSKKVIRNILFLLVKLIEKMDEENQSKIDSINARLDAIEEALKKSQFP